MSERMKVKTLREQYAPDEIVVGRVERPRSGEHIHSPVLASDNARARRNGQRTVSPRPLADILWDVDLDETVIWLTGSVGECRLQAGNVAVHVNDA